MKRTINAIKDFFTFIWWNIFFTYCIITGNKKKAIDFIWQDIEKEHREKSNKTKTT